jgi:hypothetical protein
MKTDGSRHPSSIEIARQWLVKFAALTGKAADPVLFSIWSEQLSDIPPDRLNGACDRLMKTWRYPNLPMPGDVRAQLDGADEKGFELEAANAWQDLLLWIERYYHPDIGVPRGAPALPGAVEHACRAAGGFRWIARCGEDELVWARKTFLGAYINVYQTGEIKHLLSRGEARRILSQITAPPIRQLSSGPKTKLAPDEVEGTSPSCEEVREVLSPVAGLSSPPESATQPRGAITVAEKESLAVKWADQKRRLAERAASLGMAVPAPPEVKPGPYVASDDDLPVSLFETHAERAE